MLDKAHLIWSSMSTERVMGIRKEMIEYLRGREKEGALERWGEGKVSTFSRSHFPSPSAVFRFPFTALVHRSPMSARLIL